LASSVGAAAAAAAPPSTSCRSFIQVRAFMKSFSRCTNSAGTAPPGSALKCSARKR
jgi:hypothetical protein